MKPDLMARLERALMSVMGPASVGDVNAPLNPVPDRPVEICPSCGQPQGDHEVVREPGLTYTRCPETPRPDLRQA